MPDRDEWPAGVPCWVDTAQPDPKAAGDFYSGLFGWEFEDRMPTGSAESCFVAHLGGRMVAAVGSQRTGALRRRCGTPSRRSTSPVHGTSAGSTRASRGSEGVHGAVFGWEASPFGDESGSAYWRLPGYGDFLAQSDPDVRKRNSELGAPDRFEDAVATLLPLSDDDTPPHWNITFAVDDADATADRASELGGSVLVPPMDAPWVRLTVLSDPRGALFIASKFVP